MLTQRPWTPCWRSACCALARSELSTLYTVWPVSFVFQPPRASLHEVQGLTGVLDLFLVGGFQDKLGQGEKLLVRLLRAFEQHPARVRLQLACVGCLNTGAAGEPRCTSVAFDTACRAAQPGMTCML